MTKKRADHNLMFGLIAMQSDLIEMRQFVDACTLWGSRKDSLLADILVDPGGLVAEDRQHENEHQQGKMAEEKESSDPGVTLIDADRSTQTSSQTMP